MNRPSQHLRNLKTVGTLEWWTVVKSEKQKPTSPPKRHRPTRNYGAASVGPPCKTQIRGDEVIKVLWRQLLRSRTRAVRARP